MPTPISRMLPVSLALAALSACAPVPVKKAEAPPQQAAERKVPLPNQELTSQTLYQYLLGEVALQRGQSGLAVAALLDLAKSSRDPRLAQRAAEAAVQARQIGQAVEAALLWRSLDPASTQANQTAAALLVSSGRLEEARPYLEKILAEEESGRANAFLHLNQMLTRQKDRAAVLDLVRSLAQPYPESPEAHFSVAQAAWSAGKQDESLAELDRVERLRPGWEPVALLRGQLLQRTSVKAAREYYRAYLREHPDARDVRLAYARLLVAEKDYREARAEFQRIMADGKGKPEVSFAIGVLALQEEDYEAADTYLQQALASGYRDENVVRYYLGQAAEERKRWDEAATWFDSVTQGEFYLNAQIHAAGILAKQGKLDESRARLRQIIPQDNQQRVLLIQAEAQFLRDAKRYEEAYDVLGRGLDKLPNQPDLLYDHAMAAEKVGKIEVLEKNLRHLIEIKPDHAQAYNALGYTFADRGIRLQEARQLVEKAISLAPDDPFIMDSMGWVFYRLGEHDKAVEVLRQALTLRPDPEIAAHLGEVLWVQGKKEEAHKVWQAAAQKAPDNEVLRNVMQKFK